MSKYDYQHKKRRERERRRVDAGLASCWRCRKPIIPGSEWHLGHGPDGTHAGPEHAYCNLKSAADMTNAKRSMQPRDLLDADRWSRHWENGNGYDERCPNCRELGEVCPVGAE